MHPLRTLASRTRVIGWCLVWATCLSACASHRHPKTARTAQTTQTSTERKKAIPTVKSTTPNATPCTSACVLSPIPELSTLVVDQTQTLSSRELRSLERKLLAFERKRGSQVAIIMVQSTGPESMEDYSQRAAKIYRLGRQGVGDGVLIVVALQNRQMHIAVMRRLESIITDTIAKEIIEQDLKPSFQKEKFARGLDRATTHLFRLIEASDVPMPKQPDAHPMIKISDQQRLLDLYIDYFTHIHEMMLYGRPLSMKEVYLNVDTATTLYQQKVQDFKSQHASTEHIVDQVNWTQQQVKGMERFIDQFIQETQTYPIIMRSPEFARAKLAFEGTRRRIKALQTP